MQILLLVLLLPMAMGPIWSHRQFLEVHRIEGKFIAVDNMAIQLGRADRALMKTLVRVNRILGAMEHVHHILHICRAEPRCALADKVIEKAIGVISLTAINMAKAKWQLNFASSLRELIPFQLKLCKFSRVIEPPIRRKRCPFCFLRSRLAVVPSKVPVETYLRGCTKSIPAVEVYLQLKGRSLRHQSWNYSLSLNRVRRAAN